MIQLNPFVALLISVAIASCPKITRAATADAVVAWGYADDSQTYETYWPATTRSGMTAIAVGANHTVALTADGSVLAWGLNDSGQATVPAAALSGVTAIAAGNAHTVVLKSDGSVLAWGLNETGQATVPGAARSGVMAI